MRKLLLSAVVVSLALGLAGCDDAKNKETSNAPAAKSDAPKEGAR
jgi:peptide/nickel transport system substrate-binding protein